MRAGIASAAVYPPAGRRVLKAPGAVTGVCRERGWQL